MANPLPAQFLNFPIVDPKTGLPTSDFQRWMTQTISRLANLNLDGTLNGGSGGQVDPAVLAGQVANLDANGIVLPNGIDMSRAYINKFLQYIPDGGGRYAALVPNLATQDNLPDGSSYSRTLAAYVASGVPYNFLGAWSSVTAYPKGAEVSSGNNYWLALLPSTNSAPAIGNANWQLLGPTSLDSLNDGTNYLRTTSSTGSALIVDNPNFQNGTAGWTAGSATVAVDTVSPSTNGKSLKVTTATQFAGMVSNRTWKVSPGDVIYASSQWKSDGTFVMGGGFIVYDGSGAVLVFHDLGSYSGTTWQQFTTTFTMPANADHFIWQMDRADAAGGSHSAWVTDIQLVRTSRTSDVQDGAINVNVTGSNTAVGVITTTEVVVLTLTLTTNGGWCEVFAAGTYTQGTAFAGCIIRIRLGSLTGTILYQESVAPNATGELGGFGGVALDSTAGGTYVITAQLSVASPSNGLSIYGLAANRKK